MKRIVFPLLALLSMACPSFSQNVNIPDKAFLNALIENGIDVNKDSLISYSEAKAVTYLEVDGKSISDLTGIEAFINLISLHCFNNQLTSLDVSANKAMQYLYCGYNQITSLNLPNNNSFGQLDCRDNRLTSLDVSGLTYLYYLFCTGNQLTTLDVSKNTYLQALECGYNQLTRLVIPLNTSIHWLYCQNNQLTSLDVKMLPYLSSLNCSRNQLTSLNVSMNTSLRNLDVSFMPSLYQVCVWEVPFPPAKQDINIEKTGSPNVYFTTECLPDNIVRIPDNDFRIALIDAGVDTNSDKLISFTEAERVHTLDVHGKNISDLTGIKAFKNLVEFNCADNQITSMDLSKNTLITKLNCSGNLLTNLDISMTISLQGLDLADMPSLNQVCVWDVPFPPIGYAINLAGSPNVYFTTECLSVWIPDKTFLNALIARGVDTNRDSLISYSEAEAVITLDFFNKGIADLTGISAFKNLIELQCWGNQLTSLDISNNTKLIALDLGNNKLTNLDVSKNTSLTQLGCRFNQLTDINVSTNTSLTGLDCSENQLNSIDVTKNTSLTWLSCSNNQLTIVDVSKNTLLNGLDCNGNHLTNLELSDCVELRYLDCTDNQLTSLDVSENNLLSHLNCQNNQLTGLDVSNNPDLWDLNCQNNQLVSLDISKNMTLGHLNCSGNQLTNLDISQVALSYEPVFFGGSLGIANMPGLQQVCVRELPFPTAELGLEINTTGSPNVYFTNKCLPDSIVYIPDTAFLYALIEEGVDTNGDSLISYAEAEAITYLNVYHRSISDMAGIEAFINLDTLNCSSNQLTSLNVSNNIALTSLECVDNQLTSLDVSVCTALTELRCMRNQLNSLNVSGCTALRWLYIGENPNLTEVCVWTIPFSGVSVNSEGSPNVQYTIDCTMPVIHSIVAYTNFIDVGKGVLIKCIAEESDGNSLIYNWEATGGEIVEAKPLLLSNPLLLSWVYNYQVEEGDSIGPDFCIYWVGSGISGTYQVKCSVSNSKGETTSRTIDIHVNPLKVFDGCLVANAQGGIYFFNFNGDSLGYLDLGLRSISGVEICNNLLYLKDGRTILEIDNRGDILNKTITGKDGWFTVLPDSRFAILDNAKDSIHILDQKGEIIKSVSMLHEPDNHAQNVHGIVVNNSLIVSEDGNRNLLSVDLETFEVSIFKTLKSLPWGWLGALYYFNNTFYICQSTKIWSFIDSRQDNLSLVAELPENNITSLVVVDSFAYATINFTNKIYKINVLTGEYEVFVEGIDYPEDIAVWLKNPSTSVTIEQKINPKTLKIYPNPTNHLITIETDIPGNYNIDITSINGQLILNKVMVGTDYQLDLSPFQSGVYFITVRTKDFVATRKIVKH